MGPCAAPRRGFASVVVTLCLGGGNLLTRVEAVLPTASLRLTNGGRVYASAAWFGLQIPEEEDATFLPLRVPSGDADGCEGVSVDDAPSGGFVLLVERGNCFFDVKALAAQEAGAKGLVVMNSLEGIYQVRWCWWDGCSRMFDVQQQQQQQQQHQKVYSVAVCAQHVKLLFPPIATHRHPAHQCPCRCFIL